jgi:ABC-type lipoprotein export system ATPase subunit/GNAT superfamily N-acetyltransferase
MQIESMFDVPADEKQALTWEVNLPIDEKPWNVGLIVGPSGAGKTTVARELFDANIIEELEWDGKKAIVDSFPEGMSIKDIEKYLTSVGFNTIPSWLRPYHVLSNGEKFRATMARALAETEGLVVMDEFTSVIDRNVAKVASHAVQKMVRRSDRQFIAVGCHYDIIDWLQPDWIYEPHTGAFQGRSLQHHPRLELNIREIDKSAWREFRQHHYLSSNLHTAAKCFGAFLGDQCIAFSAFRHFPHPKTRNIKMGHRLVVLPDYQGLGIGGRFDDWMGQYLYEQKFRYHNVIAHPAMINYYSASPRWQKTRHGRGVKGSKKANKSLNKGQIEFSMQRISASFCYAPPKDKYTLTDKGIIV